MRKIFIPPVLVFISLVFIILFYFFMPGFNLIMFPFNLIGIILIFIGIHISGQAHDLLKKYKTTSTFEKPAVLINEGIYKKTRNPMYLGMYAILMGIAICFQNLLSLIIPFVFIFLITIMFIRFEEKILADIFGNQYIEYKTRVKRWI